MLAGDHIYKMDYELMLQQHVDQGADVTVGCLEVPREEATGFGVMGIDGNNRIVSFLEKPKDPPTMPGKPDRCLASMGIYVFETKFLFDQLRHDAADPESSHDFGKDFIPYIVKHGKAVAHHFSSSCVRSTKEVAAYWRDVGTVDAYWAANIDLTEIVPELDIYDRDWPIWTYAELTAPAKFVHDIDGRRGLAVSSLVSGGCIVSGSNAARFAAVQPACASIPTPRSRAPWCFPTWTSAAGRGSQRSSSIAASASRRASWSARTRNSTPRRFRRTEAGVCLVTQTDDRPAPDMKSISALSVASEIYPLVKTGGLADVAGALPGALLAEDVALRTLCPGYPPRAGRAEKGRAACARFEDLFGGPARLLAGRVGALDLFVLDAPHLYDRDGGPYPGRTAAISPTTPFASPRSPRSARRSARASSRGFAPQVVHRHDWQAGLTPLICITAACRVRAR